MHKKAALILALCLIALILSSCTCTQLQALSALLPRERAERTLPAAQPAEFAAPALTPAPTPEPTVQPTLKPTAAPIQLPKGP